jgi:hypothetical protein
MSNDIDSLLDGTLDDIADLPEFKAYPPGTHLVLSSMALKDINDSKAVEFSFKYMEASELANSQDAAPKQGDESSTLFMLNNEFGAGNFKRFAEKYAEKFGPGTNREIIEGWTDLECVIVTTLRQDKNDKDKVYLNVKELEFI